MLQSIGRSLVHSFRSTYLLRSRTNYAAVSGIMRYSSKKDESDEEFDARYVAYFNRPEIDEWEIRKAMNDLQGMDLVPEPKIIIAALKACRRLNDYALAVRFLEGVKDKCGAKVKEIYPYLLQEIQPTLDELGVSTPEDMGYDKPELWLPDMFEKPFFRNSGLHTRTLSKIACPATKADHLRRLISNQNRNQTLLCGHLEI